MTKPAFTTHKPKLRLCAAALSAAAALPSLHAQTGTPVAGFPTDLQQKIKYVFILYPENRSFDGLYGNIPGVNGLAQATPDTYTQTNRTGTPLATLPQPTTSGIPGMSAGPDARFPAQMPNAPFLLNNVVPVTSMQGDMIHSFYTEQYQINDPNGRSAADPKNAGGTALSKFAAWSDNPGLVLTNYDAQNLGEGLYASLYTLCDNCFHSGFGGSFLNAQFLIAARAPVWPNTPTTSDAFPPPVTASSATQFDANGFPAVQANGSLSDGFLTNDAGLPAFILSNANQRLNPGDYWTVNTIRPLRGPAGGFSTQDTSATGPTSNTPAASRLPLQHHDTIGDRLTAAGIKWAWYSGGWNDAKAGNADFLFQFHHQPFAFFAKYALATAPVPQNPSTGAAAVPATDSAGSAQFLKDEVADFYPALKSKSVLTDLPQVIFVKPIGENNNHPGYAAVETGENWISQAVAKIQSCKAYRNSVIFISYDEHGGMWDHVTPPQVDFWGPGLRVPLTVVSPFVKHGFVDHTQYETDSMLAFIEGLYNLPPLNQHDANAIAPTAPFVGQPDLIVRAKTGAAFSYLLPAYGQPEPASVTGNLDGLSYNPATGLLTGTPASGGSYTLQVQTNVNGATQTNTLRLDVLPAADQAATAAVDTQLAGKTPSPNTLAIFSATDDAGHNYTRNPQLWCNTDLTCISAWCSAYGQNGQPYHLTAITPRHVVTAQHIYIPVGAQAVWVDAQNNSYLRTVVAVNNPVDDLMVDTLDQDLPPSVTPAAVLPATLPQGLSFNGVPAVFTNQWRNLQVAEVGSTFQSNSGYPLPDYIYSSSSSSRAPWMIQPNPAVGGDSGSPYGLLIGGRFVLMGCFHYTVGGGPDVGANAATVTPLLGNYVLSVIRL